MKLFVLNIAPMAAPRLPNKMRFSPEGKRYAKWKEDIRWFARCGDLTLEPHDSVTFRLPIAKSRRDLVPGMPHRQKPDLDNLLKALMDALHEDDAHIYQLNSVRKEWAREGQIEVRRGEP